MLRHPHTVVAGAEWPGAVRQPLSDLLIRVSPQRHVGEEVIANVVAELDLTMALVGVRDVASITTALARESPTASTEAAGARGLPWPIGDANEQSTRFLSPKTS